MSGEDISKVGAEVVVLRKQMWGEIECMLKNMHRNLFVLDAFLSVWHAGYPSDASCIITG